MNVCAFICKNDTKCLIEKATPIWWINRWWRWRRIHIWIYSYISYWWLNNVKLSHYFSLLYKQQQQQSKKVLSEFFFSFFLLASSTNQKWTEQKIKKKQSLGNVRWKKTKEKNSSRLYNRFSINHHYMMVKTIVMDEGTKQQQQKN